jgi:hypothetical protein
VAVSERFKEGEQFAFDVLARFWADGNDERTVSLPVDSVDIAGKMNISVQLVDFPDEHIASVLVKDSDMPYPRLILSKSVGRSSTARYLCAFNIARVLENEGKVKFGFVALADGSFDDDFAQGFAEGLLMPAFAVRNLYGSGKSIKKMMTYFGVTEAMLMRRFVTTGLAEAIINEDDI